MRLSGKPESEIWMRIGADPQFLLQKRQPMSN